MINLIPPSAKKSIATEYWVRVLSVWCFTWAFALTIGVCLLVPVYVLIELQVGNLTASAASASEKLASLESVTTELHTANQQAKAIIETTRVQPLSHYSALFEKLENESVTLTSMTIGRAKGGVGPIQLSGEAANRQALASFRDQLLALPEVGAVDLPISNLAKDRDIPFTLSVTLKPQP